MCVLSKSTWFLVRRNVILNTYLKPIHHSLGKSWCELPRLLKTQPIHIEYGNSTRYLGGIFHYGSFKVQHAALEHFIQGTLVVLPPFCNRSNSIQTIFIEEYASKRVTVGRFGKLSCTHFLVPKQVSCVRVDPYMAILW